MSYLDNKRPKLNDRPYCPEEITGEQEHQGLPGTFVLLAQAVCMLKIRGTKYIQLPLVRSLVIPLALEFPP